MSLHRKVSLAIQHAWDRDRDEIDRMPDADADELATAAILALAAAARQGGDVKQAPGEAPQSGPKGNAQPLPPSKDSDNHG